MKIYYITLNTPEEARQVGRSLLEQNLAVCVNWFPITCAYLWEDEIKEEPEIVLLVKTQAGYQQKIEEAVQQQITYTNLIAELEPTHINQGFLSWLDREIPILISDNYNPNDDSPNSDTIELS